MIWMADTDKLCIYINLTWQQFTADLLKRSSERLAGGGSPEICRLLGDLQESVRPAETFPDGVSREAI